MNTYDEYSLIEKHMYFSKRLFMIDIIGKKLIGELNAKKFIRKTKRKRSILSPDLARIHMLLVDITNVRKFRLRHYYFIQYYLDELLFHQVQNLDKLYVEDETHDLTEIYFAQDWISKNEFPYEFSKSQDLNQYEVNIFIVFLEEYKNFLDDIVKYVASVLDENSSIRKRLVRTAEKIKKRQQGINDILIQFIDIS